MAHGPLPSCSRLLPDRANITAAIGATTITVKRTTRPKSEADVAAIITVKGYAGPAGFRYPSVIQVD
jgi:hypothetical protein